MNRDPWLYCIEENNVRKVMAVSDACTSASGDTIGIIRVLAYEPPRHASAGGP